MSFVQKMPQPGENGGKGNTKPLKGVTPPPVTSSRAVQPRPATTPQPAHPPITDNFLGHVLKTNVYVNGASIMLNDKGGLNVGIGGSSPSYPGVEVHIHTAMTIDIQK